MKNTPLKDLGWFSFTSELDKLTQLSVYQAIAYVLRKVTALVSEVDEYEKNIHTLELESAEDIYEHYGEATNNYSADTSVKEVDPQEICIPDTEISSDVNLLNTNRITVIDYMGGPISVIYALLQAEIGKHESKSSLLDIQKTEKEGVISYSIDRKTLDKWKSISTIKELGLLDPSSLPLNRPRPDKTENEKKTMGMLIHLLANQPLEDRHGPIKFVKSSDNTNINYDRIYTYFRDNFLETPDSEFPSANTVKNNLRAAHTLFKSTVRCKWDE
jgi:hypothetical protein